MRSPLVLHVIGGGDTGGAMSYLLPLLGALRREGCDAHLLCLGSGGLARAAAARDLPCSVLPMKSAWDARVLPALRRSIAEGGWEVVHTHGMRANLPVRMMVPLVSRRPLLFTTVHSHLALDYASTLQSQSYAVMDRLSRGVVDGFCCVSEDLARRIAASGVPRERIHVVHPGMESSSGAPVRPQASGPVMGTVARLVAVKDLDLMLEAAAIVRRRVPGARVIVVGEGPERESLERRAAEADLRGSVEFLGRVESVRPALALFDVFVMTSEYEGVPLSVLEAMALGVPVVSTAVGGVPEAVEQGVTGFLVERRPDRMATAAGLAARIEELLLDQGLRRRMGEAGMVRVKENFSAEVAGRTMIRIYGRALAGACDRQGRSSHTRTNPWRRA